MRLFRRWQQLNEHFSLDSSTPATKPQFAALQRLSNSASRARPLAAARATTVSMTLLRLMPPGVHDIHAICLACRHDRLQLLAPVHLGPVHVGSRPKENPAEMSWCALAKIRQVNWLDTFHQPVLETSHDSLGRVFRGVCDTQHRNIKCQQRDLAHGKSYMCGAFWRLEPLKLTMTPDDPQR